jgi:hypothetical protein
MGCIMKTWFAAAAAVVLLGHAPASALEPPPAVASVPAPVFKAGDAWVVDQAVQKGTAGFARQRLDQSIERLNSDSMVVSVKADGAQTAPVNRIVGQDWSLKLALDGEQKTTAQPLLFPLRPGESWTSDWVDPRQQGNQLTAHFKRTYKVVGWEDVTVPAGTFHCLKIEANGTADGEFVVPSVAQATAVGQPGSATGVTHVQQGGRGVRHITTYDAIWYAPELKHMVKSIQEQYNASEVMVERDTEELVSFKPAG